VTPTSIALGTDGTVYVILSGGIGGCDQQACWNGSVSYLQAYSPTGEPKVTLSTDACPGLGNDPTCTLAVDRHGVILLANAGQVGAIARFAASGKQLAPSSGQAIYGTDGVVVDARGDVYASRGYFNELDELSPKGRHSPPGALQAMVPASSTNPALSP
jgi:hypothetical protein